jgi:prevent-host-death family protein
MAMRDSADTISLAAAGTLGIAALIREAAAGREQIIERDGKPVAVVMGIERYDQLQQLRDDLTDITLAASRTMTDSGVRYTLDDILAHFGFTRAELASELTVSPDAEDPVSPAKSRGRFRPVDRETHPVLGR